ncbi:hypothetical protein CEXT_101631 [Caerostris extrusa]|uniref:Uncharacterized protein n=1 Tax=Caerostris extrusa TaxID=172846 RepID=A0AAV4NBE9_CAEEX|nr:hypothetical protein CEXT_101631 [Caerostris extrusa]
MEFKDVLFSDPKQFEKGFLLHFLVSFCCKLHGVCQFTEGTCLKFDSDFFLFPSECCSGQHHQGHTKAWGGTIVAGGKDKIQVTASSCSVDPFKCAKKVCMGTCWREHLVIARPDHKKRS